MNFNLDYAKRVLLLTQCESITLWMLEICTVKIEELNSNGIRNTLRIAHWESRILVLRKDG